MVNEFRRTPKPLRRSIPKRHTPSMRQRRVRPWSIRPSPPDVTDHQVNLSKVVRHKPILRPPCLCRVSGRKFEQFTPPLRCEIGPQLSIAPDDAIYLIPTARLLSLRENLVMAICT